MTTPIRHATLALGLTLISIFSFAQKPQAAQTPQSPQSRQTQTQQSPQVHEPQSNDPEWTKPYPPFRIAGNLYYVGTADLSSYLIVTRQGNILINTGLASSTAQIKKNIETLGFKYKDIKVLLTNQCHYDHVAAMAEIKKATGAKMYIDEKDAEVLADGGSSDPVLGHHTVMFQPVKADRLLHDKDTITLGETTLTILHHPGHTKGSCSFLFTTKDKDRSWKVLIANIPTVIVDKKFVEVTAYPDIAKDYAYTFEAMEKLNFDIWVAAHAGQFDMQKKHPTDAYNPAAFEDKKGYEQALNDARQNYRKKL